MNLYIITGDKGGIGKSLISSLITDYIYRDAFDNNRNAHILLCDCDKREDGQSSFTRMTFNLHNSDNIHIERNFFELDTIDGFTNLFAKLCSSTLDFAVIDTGANMLIGLNDSYRLLHQYSNAFPNIKIKIIFVVASNCDSSFAAKEYLESFFNCKNIHTTFILNHDKKRRNTNFDFSNDEMIQDIISRFNNNNDSEKINVVEYNYIPETIFNLSNFDGRDVKLPFQILHDNDTNPALKIAYEIWLSDSDKAIQGII